MDAGQILQVVLSLGVVALALYLSARLARRRLGPGIDEALRVVARQSVSRTQNLVVVEANGHRHLVALTDGGAHTVESWDVPVEAVASGPKHAAPRPAARPVLTLPSLPRPSLSRPSLSRPSLTRPAPARRTPDPEAAGQAAPSRSVPAGQGPGRRAKPAGPASGRAAATAPQGSFAATLAALQAQTQWAPLGHRK